MVWGLQNLTAAWADVGSLDGLKGEIGTFWKSAINTSIEQLGWYRPSTTAGSKPEIIRVWDPVTQAELARLPSVPDSGAIGWQRAALAEPLAVVGGKQYLVTMAFQNVNHWAQASGASFPAPPTPLQTPSPLRRYGVANTWGYPAGGQDSSFLPGVDAFTPAGEGGGGGTGDSTLTGDLADWLDTVLGGQPNSAPLVDHATLATVDTNVAAVAAQQNEWAFGLGAAAHGYFATIQTLINNVKSITDTLPTPINRLSSIVLDHYTADIAMILEQIDSILANLGAQSTDLSGTAGSAVGALSGRTGFPATGWTMSAEESFDGAIAFAEPADSYVLHITSYQPTQPATSSPAGLWLPRIGWWCVLNGSLASQRSFVDFEQELLDDGGRRMPGCAIQLKPGTLATVQAWLLA